MKGHGLESRPMTLTSSSMWLTQIISVWETAFWEIKLICNLCYWFTFCGSASIESIYKKLDKPLIGSSIKKLLTGHPKIVFEFQFWTFLRRANRKKISKSEKKKFSENFRTGKIFWSEKKFWETFFSAKAEIFFTTFLRLIRSQFFQVWFPIGNGHVNYTETLSLLFNTTVVDLLPC